MAHTCKIDAIQTQLVHGRPGLLGSENYLLFIPPCFSEWLEKKTLFQIQVSVRSSDYAELIRCVKSLLMQFLYQLLEPGSKKTNYVGVNWGKKKVTTLNPKKVETQNFLTLSLSRGVRSRPCGRRRCMVLSPIGRGSNLRTKILELSWCLTH